MDDDEKLKTLLNVSSHSNIERNPFIFKPLKLKGETCIIHLVQSLFYKRASMNAFIYLIEMVTLFAFKHRISCNCQ